MTSIHIDGSIDGSIINEVVTVRSIWIILLLNRKKYCFQVHLYLGNRQIYSSLEHFLLRNLQFKPAVTRSKLNIHCQKKRIPISNGRIIYRARETILQCIIPNDNWQMDTLKQIKLNEEKVPNKGVPKWRRTSIFVCMRFGCALTKQLLQKQILNTFHRPFTINSNINIISSIITSTTGINSTSIIIIRDWNQRWMIWAE